jgi:hypothetical protein
MTRSIVIAGLLVAALAACARNPAPPQPAADNSLVSGFVPYCGSIWLVDKQGYVNIPCPPDSNYPGAP